MGDLDDFDNEINTQLDNFQKEIDNIGKKEASQRPQAIAKCYQKVKQIQNWIDTYELEVTTTASNNKKYKESLKNIRGRYDKLKTELEFKKTENSANNVLFNNRSRIKDPSEMTSDELIQLGDQTQGKSKDALGRIMNRIHEGNDVLDNVAVELHAQEDKLINTQKNLKDTQTVLKRTEQLIKYFGRQLMTDKLLLCLLILVVVAILVIIILKLTGISTTLPDDQLKKT